MKARKKRSEQLDENYKIAYDFALKAYRKFNKIIKSIALFGSTVKKTSVKGSDIDIIIIIDDASIVWDQELIAWYREELGKLIAKQDYGSRLHVSTVTLTAFWNDIRQGEPTVINVLRTSQTLIDIGGFFEPLKVLLAKGKIKPTPESVYTTLKRAPIHLSRSRYNVLTAIEGLYWAMVDSAHAVLIASGNIPPSPEHIPKMLRENKEIKLKEKYVKWFEEMYKVAHSVTHGNITSIAGKEIDVYDKKANQFVSKMTDITQKLLKDEKIIRTKFKK